MAPVQGPIVPRRRLGAELRRLREEAGKTLDEVAHHLMISTSKLSRLENAQGSPQARDVRDLSTYYGVDAASVGEQLIRWAAAGRRQGWWASYEEVLERDPSFDSYLAYETEAAIAHVYTLPYITGLLQTAEYTAALIAAMEPWRTPEEIDRFVQVRKLRQQGLYHRDGIAPLELKTILHESCLTQTVGTPEIMHAQLDTLIKAVSSSEFPKAIDLRVLPVSSTPHRMNTCTWSYFVFADALDRDVVNIETHAGFLHIEKAEDVRRYERAFEELTRRSLDNAESCELIESIMSAPVQ